MGNEEGRARGQGRTADLVAGGENISTDDTVASDGPSPTSDAAEAPAPDQAPDVDQSISTDDTVGPAPDSAADQTLPASDARATDLANLVCRDQDTVGSPVSPPDSRRYARGDEIARGGMGRIVSMYDRELGRNLAVKELLAPTPALAKRFQREVRITARLQHPGIIGVHSAGRWPTGEPFYTMNHVKGRALDKVIAELETVQERLSLLPNVIAVADELSYAHSQGVIHRDLKPANVLVGDYGETVVIDWGLAKELQRDDEGAEIGGPELASSDGLTVLGEALGTPAYMPPKQARGESVDERADVYALGALLYHLLAGQRPYADTKARGTAELLETVKRRPPTALSTLAPDAPLDLLAIVAKAMDRSADERYANAAEMTADLKRFETGQLVGAYEYSTSALIGRWIQRHRAPVIVAAVMVMMLAATGVFSFVRITRERDQSRVERKQATEDRAEVEGLLDFMLRDLHEKLQPVGKTALLDMVARRARDYYDRRPIDWARPEEARKRADAHDNIAEVLKARGDLDGALVEYRAGEAIRARLVRLDPDNQTRQHDLSLSYDRIGWLHRARGDLDGALAQFRAGMVIGERLAKQAPQNLNFQRDLGVGHDKIADVLKDQGELEGALAEYRAGMIIAERISATDRTNLDWQRDLSVGHNNLADTLLAMGRTADAIAEYRAGRAILERLVESDAKHVDWRYGLVLNCLKLGTALDLEAGPTNSRARASASAPEPPALLQYRLALTAVEQLVRHDPSNIAWQRALATSHALLGAGYSRTGDGARSIAHLTSSAEIYERIPGSASDYVDGACVYALIGDLDRAFAMLARAATQGYANPTHLYSEPQLAPLREDPRWEPLLTTFAPNP